MLKPYFQIETFEEEEQGFMFINLLFTRLKSGIPNEAKI